MEKGFIGLLLCAFLACALNAKANEQKAEMPSMLTRERLIEAGELAREQQRIADMLTEIDKSEISSPYICIEVGWKRTLVPAETMSAPFKNQLAALLIRRRAELQVKIENLFMGKEFGK